MSEPIPFDQEMYKQGSEACRNYSGLTQRTRTLTLVATIVAIAAPFASLAKGVDIEVLNPLLRPGGIVLMMVALSLGLVDWHYQSAFQAIRNVLARLESVADRDGPWRAHFDVRGSWRDFIASYLPFGLLFAVGAVAAGSHFTKDAGLYIHWKVRIVLAMELIAGAVLMAKCLDDHAKKAESINNAGKATPTEPDSASEA